MAFDSLEQLHRESDLRKKQLDETDEKLCDRASDDTTVKELVQKLIEGGTADVQRDVQRSVEQAGDTIRTEFEADHEEATREQAETEQLERQVENDATADTRNAEELAAARAELHSEDVERQLDEASEKLTIEAAELHKEREGLGVRRETSEQVAERLLRQVLRERHT